MARPARIASAIDASTEYVSFIDGGAMYLASLTRNDLRNLAGQMRVSGGKEQTNSEMLTAIRHYLTVYGSWASNNPEPAPRSIPMPKMDGIPHCLRCFRSMVRRRNKETGAEFWGCSMYPACNGTRHGDYRVPTPTPNPEPDPSTDYPYTLHCPTNATHPSVIVHGPSDERWALKCAICGASMDRTEPKTEPAPNNEYTEQLEAEVISLTERAESAELQIKAMLPIPDYSTEPVMHEVVPKVISALQAGSDAVYLAGPPGTGKSHIGQSVASALGLSFNPFSCYPGMTDSKLFGYMDANGIYHSTGLRRSVEFGGVFVLDEVDNGNSSLLAALNSLISNGMMEFPDGVITKHADFKLITTANTWGTGPTAEFMGRLGLDKATLDRMTRIEVDIDTDLEAYVTQTLIHADVADRIIDAVRTIRKRVDEQGLRILVSPRMTYSVAKLMHAGWTMANALGTTSLATVDAGTRSQLLSGIEGVDGA